MSLTLLVCITAFVGVAALVGGVAMLVSGDIDNVAEDRLGILTGKTNPNKQLDKAATVITKPLDEVPNALDRFTARFLDLNLFLEQANLSFSPGVFVIISGVLFLLGCGVASLTGLTLVLAPLAGFALGVFPLAFAFFRRGLLVAARAAISRSRLPLSPLSGTWCTISRRSSPAGHCRGS